MNKKKENIGYLSLEVERFRELLNDAIRSHGISSKEALYYGEKLDKLVIRIQLHDQKNSCCT